MPLIVIAIYAFNESRSQAWPIEGLTLEWFERAFDNPGVDALDLAQGGPAPPRLRSCSARSPRWPSSPATASGATPSRSSGAALALPGIVTGMALNATFTQVLGVDLTLFTVIVGHATFA